MYTDYTCSTREMYTDYTCSTREMYTDYACSTREMYTDYTCSTRDVQITPAARKNEPEVMRKKRVASNVPIVAMN